MKKSFIRYSIKIGIWAVLWLAMFSVSDVFGATATTDSGKLNAQDSILNKACIEYTTPSWTGIKCNNVKVYYKTGTTQPHEYFLQKWQKTWSMTNFTTWQVIVESGEYIQYKVEFGSITWNCRNGTIKDTLPACVKFVSSQIYDVSGNPTLSTWNGYVQYTNFSLSSGGSGYIIVTWQVTTNGRGCQNRTGYINTWSFRCNSPESDWMHSSVVAIRTWWDGWWSGYDVSIKKSVNKSRVRHGEEIIYYIDYTNEWRDPLTGYTVTDYWPNDQLEFISSNPDPTTNNGNTITWSFVWPLRPWKSERIIIHARVK